VATVNCDGGDDYGDDDFTGAMHEALSSDEELCVCRQISKQARRIKSDQIERMKRGNVPSNSGPELNRSSRNEYFKLNNNKHTGVLISP